MKLLLVRALFFSLLFACNAYAQVKVAVIVPRTGPFAPIGKQIISGLRSSLRSHFATSGTVELLTEDSEGLPGPAISKVDKVVENENAAIVVGLPLPGTAAATTPVLQRMGVITLSLAEATNRDIRNESQFDTPFVFHLLGRDSDRISDFTNLLSSKTFSKYRSTYASKKIYMYVPDFLRETAKSVLRRQSADTSEYSLNIKLYSDFDNFVSVLSNERSTSVGAFFTMMVSAASVQKYIAYDGHGYNGNFILATPVMPSDYRSLIHDPYSHSSRPHFVILSNPLGHLPGHIGRPTPGYAPYGFMAGQIIADIMRSGIGSFDPDSVSRVLRQKTFNTVVGKVRFGNGGIVRGLHPQVASWEGDRYVIGDVCRRKDCAQFPQCKKTCNSGG